ncbi:hypothetical protein B0H17DRAFT_1207419 [Mycena rosella]|uniref:Saccharopine dehydrogenase-like C-terminal domain-containing protein n=1 Tax=Mycena rosella TaxID=1033263 RepID=A0AAD7D2W7_MYCRO|nr:hypothetical protein B0H17DRAFT_1207419 [Mycena rosella]
MPLKDSFTAPRRSSSPAFGPSSPAEQHPQLISDVLAWVQWNVGVKGNRYWSASSSAWREGKLRRKIFTAKQSSALITAFAHPSSLLVDTLPLSQCSRAAHGRPQESHVDICECRGTTHPHAASPLALSFPGSGRRSLRLGLSDLRTRPELASSAANGLFSSRCVVLKPQACGIDNSTPVPATSVRPHAHCDGQSNGSTEPLSSWFITAVVSIAPDPAYTNIVLQDSAGSSSHPPLLVCDTPFLPNVRTNVHARLKSMNNPMVKHTNDDGTVPPTPTLASNAATRHVRLARGHAALPLFSSPPMPSSGTDKDRDDFPHIGIIVLNEAGLGPEPKASTTSHGIDAFTFDALPNHGSVPFREFYNISEAEKVFRGRVRNAGFTAFLAALVKFGWLAVNNGQRTTFLLDVHVKFFKALQRSAGVGSTALCTYPDPTCVDFRVRVMRGPPPALPRLWRKQRVVRRESSSERDAAARAADHTWAAQPPRGTNVSACLRLLLLSPLGLNDSEMQRLSVPRSLLQAFWPSRRLIDATTLRVLSMNSDPQAVFDRSLILLGAYLSRAPTHGFTRLRPWFDRIFPDLAAVVIATLRPVVVEKKPTPKRLRAEISTKTWSKKPKTSSTNDKGRILAGITNLPVASSVGSVAPSPDILHTDVQSSCPDSPRKDRQAEGRSEASTALLLAPKGNRPNSFISKGPSTNSQDVQH